MRPAITIKRYRLRKGSYNVWGYNYTVSGDYCQYGSGLSELLSMLKRRFPDYAIIKAWEA